MRRERNEDEREGKNPYVMPESWLNRPLESNAWDDIRGQMIITAQMID